MPVSSSSNPLAKASSAPSTSTTTKTTATSTTTSGGATATKVSTPDEDRLHKLWRSYVSNSLMQCFEKADVAAKDTSRPNCEALQKSIFEFLQYRKEWHRQLSTIEATLQGRAQERESLDCYVRTRPRVGRSRKRAKTEALPVVVLEEDLTQK